MADGVKNIRVVPVFNSETIAASGTATSPVIDLDSLRSEGNFSVKLTLTGSGTCKLEYLLAETDTATFLLPASAVDIISSFTSSSGTSGVDIIPFSLELAPKMKIKATETGGANSITISVKLIVQ